MAKESGVTTVLLTGKGEPTLFPDQITEFMRAIQTHKFPFVELQTNGILLDENWKIMEPYLRLWYELGMTMVAISIAHHKAEINNEITVPEQSMRLAKVIKNLHSVGLSVRLSVVMVKGGIDSVEEINNLVTFARRHEIEQLTVRPVSMPARSRNRKVAEWIKEHSLTAEQIENIEVFLRANGTLLLNLMHGAQVFDYNGQNICLTNCLTHSADPEEVRQLIYFPDGHLRYDWVHKGALLL